MSEKDANDPGYYQELIHKLVTGTISPSEKQLLEEWYHANQDNPINIPASFANSEREHAMRLLSKIRQKTASDTTLVPVQRASVITAYRWWAAAAVLLLLGMATWLYITKSDQPNTHVVTNTNITWQVVTSAPGDIKEVVLPDGSQVWLNSASSLRYPSSFAANERKVELTGEAWFDVQHAEKIPFLISSGAITTQVVGTAFDIKAYPGQKVMTVSVQRGKVKVLAGNSILATLEKGRQVRINEDTTTYQRDIDTSAIGAWKQGNLLYKDEILKDIVADLQRVFKDSVEIKNDALKEEKITIVFNKNVGLPKALRMIAGLTDSRVVKRNEKYIIE